MTKHGAHAASPGRHRRRTTPLLAAALALVAVLGWQAARLLPREDASPASGTDVAEAGTPPPGTHIEVTLADDGSMHAVETLVLHPARARLRLSVPQRAGAAADFSPRVVSLTVRGGEVRQAPTSLASGDRATVRLAGPATRVVLAYDVRHAMRHPKPSPPERALALMTPLVVDRARDSPIRVVMDSVRVLNVGCVGPSGELTGCGSRTPQGWTVETSGAAGDPAPVDVLAQVDLATP